MAGSSGSDGSKAIEPLLPLLTQDIITALQLLGFNFRKALGEPLRQLLADFPLSKGTRTGLRSTHKRVRLGSCFVTFSGVDETPGPRC